MTIVGEDEGHAFEDTFLEKDISNLSAELFQGRVIMMKLVAEELGHLGKQFIPWSCLFGPIGAELLARPFV